MIRRKDEIIIIDTTKRDLKIITKNYKLKIKTFNLNRNMTSYVS